MAYALDKNEWHATPDFAVRVRGIDEYTGPPTANGRKWMGTTPEGQEVRIAYSWGQVVFGVGTPKVPKPFEVPEQNVGLLGVAVVDTLGATEEVSLGTVKEIIKAAGWPVAFEQGGAGGEAQSGP